MTASSPRPAALRLGDAAATAPLLADCGSPPGGGAELLAPDPASVTFADVVAAKDAVVRAIAPSTPPPARKPSRRPGRDSRSSTR
ncbi:hypothetical protein [Nonomuraea aurantiaca]|jgi:hypothetical protein|uniref:hypothetical protein n=1 Tax=Nonomuraea aurantiaca TaxID=2878562 RepID=UPI001CDA4E61|nr:hypothetical protein [Nonomuraea aurantiaca]MCA2229459.1 hypothetical protein [Nonomuraea aurantiaca]